MIKPTPHIAKLSPYALSQITAPAGKSLVALSQNESFRPPSPVAIAAALDALQNAHLYPDPDWNDLRKELATRHAIRAEDILCGNGSMELIASIAMAFANEDNAILAPAFAYPFFETAAKLARARYDVAALNTIARTPDEILAQLRPDTRILFIDNPGNPTGLRLQRKDIVNLRDALPADVLLVIDEAYGEFADHLNEPMFDLVDRGDTIILRSLSKAYGLAGMRVGWGLFPPVVAQELRKVLNPNNISRAGQVAATQAVVDHTYMRETCDLTASLRDAFIERTNRNGMTVLESHTNFALIQFRDKDTALKIDGLLRAEGIILRPQGGVGLPHCLRVTIGTADQLNHLSEILEGFARKGMI